MNAEQQADIAIRGNILVDGVQIHGTVVVDNGQITTVANTPEYEVEAKENIHLQNDEVLIPGIVDTHVHINEPGRTEWEGFECATQAAAAGGVTTVLDMPLNSNPPTLTCEALDLKNNAPCTRRMCNLASGAV